MATKNKKTHTLSESGQARESRQKISNQAELDGTVYKILEERSRKFLPGNYTEIHEDSLVVALRINHPTVDKFQVREIMRRFADDKIIELAPGDSGFPYDEGANHSYRFKISKEAEYNITEQKEKSSGKKASPFTVIYGDIGYLKFYREGETIKIGRKDSQPFKLLQSLTEPYFGIRKAVDAVFEAIRENIYAKNKPGISNPATEKAEKIKIIEYAIKELQKGNKLQGKIKFNWSGNKREIWLEYLG